MTNIVRPFGVTGQEVLRIGLGTDGHGHAFGGIPREQSLAIMDAVCARLPASSRILIDTAPRYGHGAVETWIGEFLQTRGGSCLVATKGGRHIEPGRDNEKDFTRDFIERDLEGSLRRLRVDSIFLYQLHNPRQDVIERAEVFEVLEGFRSRRLIQWYGVSIDEPTEGFVVMEACRRRGFRGLASLQVIFSVIAKAGRNTLFGVAAQAGVAVIAREVLARGFLTDRYSGDFAFGSAPSAVRKLLSLYGAPQLLERARAVRDIAALSGLSTAQAALCFASQHPSVTVALAGINRPHYVEEDCLALTLSLPSEINDGLNQIADAEVLASS